MVTRCDCLKHIFRVKSKKLHIHKIIFDISHEETFHKILTISNENAIIMFMLEREWALHHFVLYKIKLFDIILSLTNVILSWNMYMRILPKNYVREMMRIQSTHELFRLCRSEVWEQTPTQQHNKRHRNRRKMKMH